MAAAALQSPLEALGADLQDRNAANEADSLFAERAGLRHGAGYTAFGGGGASPTAEGKRS